MGEMSHIKSYGIQPECFSSSQINNKQLTVAIRTDSNRELYLSTVYCPHGNPSIELIDGLCANRDQVILAGDLTANTQSQEITTQIAWYQT